MARTFFGHRRLGDIGDDVLAQDNRWRLKAAPCEQAFPNTLRHPPRLHVLIMHAVGRPTRREMVREGLIVTSFS